MALDWVDRSTALLELEELLLLPPPTLRVNGLKPPPAEPLLWAWLFSTCTSKLESLEFCCWYSADTNWAKVVWTEYRVVSDVVRRYRSLW